MTSEQYNDQQVNIIIEFIWNTTDGMDLDDYIEVLKGVRDEVELRLEAAEADKENLKSENES